MKLEVIEKGKVIKNIISENGVVTRTSIGVDTASDVLLCVGDIYEVEEKVSILNSDNSPSIVVLPLYSKLSHDDCDFVVTTAINYTASKFLVELAEVFFTDKLEDWLKAKKKEKTFYEIKGWYFEN